MGEEIGCRDGGIAWPDRYANGPTMVGELIRADDEAGEPLALPGGGRV